MSHDIIIQNNSLPKDLSFLDKDLSAALSEAKELQQSVRSLPKVDPKGNSECPFAEELYAKKEELQKKVEYRFEQLHVYLELVEEIINEIKKDLGLITYQEDQLQRQPPKQHYSDAKTELAGKYQQHRNLQEEVKRVMQVVDEVLQQAVAKRYPGKIPQKWPGHSRRPAPIDRKFTRRQYPPQIFDDEIGELINLENQRQNEKPQSNATKESSG